MKCQICNKNEAQIVFTQIIDNEKIVMQICTECAKKKGLSIEIESVPPKPPSPEILLGLFSGETEKKEEKNIPELKCDLCGLTFAKFKKSGLFGCDKCHEAFGERIKDILKQIHGTDLHEIKAPVEVSKKAEAKHRLKELKVRLKHSVEIEDYEMAAELRDKINEIQKGISSQ